MVEVALTPVEATMAVMVVEEVEGVADEEEVKWCNG